MLVEDEAGLSFLGIDRRGMVFNEMGRYGVAWCGVVSYGMVWCGQAIWGAGGVIAWLTDSKAPPSIAYAAHAKISCMLVCLYAFMLVYRASALMKWSQPGQ